MKRLLLLIILFPVILLAQTRRKDIIDSNREVAAINLQSIPASMGNNQCARVADIRIIDNGEFTTIIVFRHIITALDSAGKVNAEESPVSKADVITALLPLSFVKLNTDNAPFSKAEIVISLPPLPDVQTDVIAAFLPFTFVKLNTENTPFSKAEIVISLPPLPDVQSDVLTAFLPLTFVKLNIENTPFGRAEIVLTLPPLPDVQTDTITAISPLHFVKLNTENIQFSKAEIIITILPLPDVQTEVIAATSPSPFIKLNTENIPVSKAEIVLTIPPLPDVLSDIITAISPLSIVKINIENIPFSKAELVINIPTLPDVQMDDIDAISPLPLVKLNTENIPFSKAEIVQTLPKIEEDRTPVEEMHLSQDGYSLLQKLEGFSPELYALGDGGYTLGFGFFIPFSEGAKWNKGISWEEAEHLIQQKVPAYEDQVKQYINVPLTQKEFDALTIFAYNLGGFSKATSIVNDINNQADFEQLQSDWKRFVHSKAPNVSKGLMKRRQDELDVRGMSNYQPDRKILILKSRKK